MVIITSLSHFPHTGTNLASSRVPKSTHCPQLKPILLFMLPIITNYGHMLFQRGKPLQPTVIIIIMYDQQGPPRGIILGLLYKCKIIYMQLHVIIVGTVNKSLKLSIEPTLTTNLFHSGMVLGNKGIFKAIYTWLIMKEFHIIA